jgi:hypothetical protein
MGIKSPWHEEPETTNRSDYEEVNLKAYIKYNLLKMLKE